ncbi:MAG: tRNA pseudouridine55 synthase [Spirochaetes bacterium]|nr:MAG: tRNA pseudouridine55 synthase [Spirochaetota bacterium]
MTESGFLLMDKVPGMTSFKALEGIKRIFPGSKIGHTGTLDSFASGLLVVMVGGYSRLAPWFVGLDKRYRAEFSFGMETDTLDPVGKPVKEGPLPGVEELMSAIPGLTGPISQIPPRYSALHIQGKRASDLAVRGVDFEISPRDVTIYSFVMKSYARGKAIFDIHCSSGTYVRSLARDIAHACGTVAHVSRLERLSVGPFRLEETGMEGDYPDFLKSLDPETAIAIGLKPMILDPQSELDFSLGRARSLRCLRDLPHASPEPKPPAGKGDAREGFRDIATFDSRMNFVGIARETVLLDGQPGQRSFALVLNGTGI